MCKTHMYTWLLTCIKICVCSGLIQMLNTTDKISAKTEQALIWNECTSKHLLLNSTTNVKLSYTGSGHGEDEIK